MVYNIECDHNHLKTVCNKFIGKYLWYKTGKKKLWGMLFLENNPLRATLHLPITDYFSITAHLHVLYYLLNIIFVIVY